MRAQPGQSDAKPLVETGPAGSRHKLPRSSKQAHAGSPPWERTLHPKVRQFLDAASKLDWSKLP